MAARKNDSAERHAEQEFVISRVFVAPRDRVWKAFTEEAERERGV